jgi:hypothetical protein
MSGETMLPIHKLILAMHGGNCIGEDLFFAIVQLVVEQMGSESSKVLGKHIMRAVPPANHPDDEINQLLRQMIPSYHLPSPEKVLAAMIAVQEKK